jgi:hypothetical protein
MDEERVMEEAQKAAWTITSRAADDYMASDSLLAKAVRKGLL